MEGREVQKLEIDFMTSLCASVSSSLKQGNDRTSIRGLLWDYGSPCVKVLSAAGMAVMTANGIPV